MLWLLRFIILAALVLVLVFGGEAWQARRRGAPDRHTLAVMAALWAVVLLLAAILLSTGASAHGVYTGVHGKDGTLCCGADDCAETVYRERGAAFEFLTRDKHWVAIPEERITFLPIPGDPPDGPSNKAHLCYFHPADPASTSDQNRRNLFTSIDGAETIYLWCAFIPPGGA